MNMKDKLNNKIEMIEKVDMRICDLYIKLIEAICYYIEFQIVPQIEVIQSFLECESVKNIYIADTKAKTINMKWILNFMIIQSTKSIIIL